MVITVEFGKLVSMRRKKGRAMIDPALVFIDADGYFLLKARKPKQTN
jgi:hypothetical protein